ncbi:DUF4097 family beta strand repeat-containing protein [Cyclobacterium salsum]|uniref:DUF4097 family beta strand repeat-containing protein n=1 Tax=Cyclobacterium salsum TaxID=2666329 RepID=UPI001391B589|nr:DUF4097 family beta strand repeat-containing protein [Cyclobacterium salsum]
MSRIKILFGVAVMLILSIGCNPLPKETITDIDTSFEGIRKVIVQGGALEISYTGGDDTEKVYLTAFLESTDAGTEGIHYEQSGDELIVSFDSEMDFSFLFGRQVDGFISLKGPREMELDMYNSSGKLEVYHVRNENIKLRGSSGSIDAKDLDSPNLQVKISSGKAQLENIQGNLDLELSSGMGSLDGMKGSVRFKGSSGLVQIADVDGLVTGEMSSGKADLYRVATLGEISLSSGMLVAEDCGLGAESYFSASSGYMKVTTNTDLSRFNFDFSVGSGRLSIGDQSSSEDLVIDHGASETIRGKLRSGRMVLEGT